MKLNAGFITDKIAATKTFYMENLGFGVSFENDFYLLLHTPDQKAEIAFLLPHHPTQQPVFHQPYPGVGAYLTIEVEQVDEYYQRISKTDVPIVVELREEPWGDRHFSIVDPNGLNIDIVTYTAPAE